MTAFATNLVIVTVLISIVAVALLVARSIFGTVSAKSTAVELGARLMNLPAATPGALRRRFARAITSQHLIMPSGERHGQPSLVVRISPEDRDRLAPDGDLNALERDAERLYLNHAERQQWKVPHGVRVSIEVDPVLRPGWIPPARAVGGSPNAPEARLRDTDAQRAAAWARVASPRPVMVDVPAARDMADIGDPEDTGPIAATLSAPATVNIDATPTEAVGGELELVGPEGSTRIASDAIVVLGRGEQSPLLLSAPEVSGRHAAIRHRSGRWEIRDLASTNGTKVDGERLRDSQWHAFSIGSVISVADVELAVRSGVFGTVSIAGGQ